MKTSEILDQAADVIEQRGWWRGDYMPDLNELQLRDVTVDSCPVCLLGGLNVAVGNAPDEPIYREANSAAFAAASAFADHLGIPLTVSATSLGDDWNDRQRSAEDVVRELRAAAASEREAGR